ncbi:MAG: hypothetical protein M3442_17125 [Chloroflexota bacterium]|nr:hypothetical protein [Chloroflexota bacterium]
MRARLGRGAEVVQYSDENYFTLESHDAAWPVARIAREFGLETFRDCHARATRLQDQARGAGTTPGVPAPAGAVAGV